MKKELYTDLAPKAIGPYSQGIELNGLIFLSGQIPINPHSGNIPETIDDQTTQVLSNITAVLEQSGSNLSKIVKTTIFVKNIEHAQTINEIYAHYFSAPYPARSLVEVARLPKDVLIEIEVIAYKGD
jgi:2-iminobutanoate/2-iminopropanoate deaminase